MRRPRVAIDAAMLAAAIGIDRAVEADIRGLVPTDRGAASNYGSGWCRAAAGRRCPGQRSPPVVEGKAACASNRTPGLLTVPRPAACRPRIGRVASGSGNQASSKRRQRPVDRGLDRSGAFCVFFLGSSKHLPRAPRRIEKEHKDLRARPGRHRVPDKAPSGYTPLGINVSTRILRNPFLRPRSARSRGPDARPMEGCSSIGKSAGLQNRRFRVRVSVPGQPHGRSPPSLHRAATRPRRPVRFSECGPACGRCLTSVRIGNPPLTNGPGMPPSGRDQAASAARPVSPRRRMVGIAAPDQPPSA